MGIFEYVLILTIPIVAGIVLVYQIVQVLKMKELERKSIALFFEQEKVKPIFLITCFEKCERNNGWFDGGAQRSFGFRYSFKEAEEALNKNICDMHETIYHYAVVEELGPYIHPCPPDSEAWFKWDSKRQGFYQIEKPEETNGSCNFGAIG